MMMHNKKRCLMMVVGAAALIGALCFIVMGMEEKQMDPEAAFVKIMDHMSGMMS